MRLLQYSESGELSIHNFDDGNTPAYTILSHTWGADGDEVTFADLESGHGKGKLGYRKILFCAKQTRRDELQYFWIDTCCINKANKAELAFSIRSMFRWYRNATRCYVYLSDVSSVPPSAIDKAHYEPRWRIICSWILSIIYTLLGGSSSTVQLYFNSRHVPCSSISSDPVRNQQNPKSTLDQSRWFTRGWTLQELLAPSTVEFFSKEGTKLGDKLSLAEELREITRIPSSALQGKALSDFDVHERISWSEHRTTKIPADRAYSLMGILGVSLSPIDGESAPEAMKRVYEEVEKLNRYLQDLRPSDPRDDKKRIEDTKGGLLTDSYRWILNNTTFQQWRQEQHNQLLWVKGNPGKGKTMLLCGIINELKDITPQTALLSYFFCQATDSRLNSATAVLRGLLYMLVYQQPELMSYVRKKYDHAGKGLFEDINAWVVLAEIFTEMLRDESISTTTCLIVDALDECVIDQPKLLSLIAKQSSASTRIKWIVSSRNWPVIEEQLRQAEHKTKLSLELNADSVAAAVKIFIQQKVFQLAQEKYYTQEVQDVVLQHLESNANDTFLWVALVCQDLKTTPRWKTFDKRRALEKLAQFPPGLDSLYERMLQQIHDSDNAEICFRILAVAAVLYRPVTVVELTALVEPLEDFVDNLDLVREMIDLCGSFLTMRDDTVYFVHQSAKDFLLAEASNEVFPKGVKDIHQAIFSASVAALYTTLGRDMYSLKSPACAVDNVILPQVDPLARSRYSCVYWIDHLYDAKPTLPAFNTTDHKCETQLTEVIYWFLKKKYLYWLEGLSLCNSIEQGVLSMAKLRSLMQTLSEQDRLIQLVQDAHRFITYHKQAIETYPLQTYASALLFSPANSIIRQLFQHEGPNEISIKPLLNKNWDACLQTLEGHGCSVQLVASLHDSTMLVSASDEIIKIWDISSGACLQTLPGHGHGHTVQTVAFSQDSTRLASASNNTAKIWDISNGVCLRTLDGYGSNSVTFSHDLTRLATGLGRTVKIWDVSSSACLWTLEGHSHIVDSVVFSHDSIMLAAVSDEIVKIWDITSGACLLTIQGRGPNNSPTVNSVAFSHDLTSLATGSNQIVQIWDISSSSNSNKCVQTLKGHSDIVNLVVFSPDFPTRLASASDDRTVKIWDTNSGACLQTLKGHNYPVNSVAFFHKSTRLASASDDESIKIWDANYSAYSESFESHKNAVDLVAFSHDSTMLASASTDSILKIWITSSGACLHTLRGHSRFITSVAFSRDSTTLASASGDKTIRIWDTGSGACLQTLYDHRSTVYSIAFSHDSTRLASGSGEETIKIWDTSSDTSVCLQTLKGHSRYVTSVAFSHDSTMLASASADRTVKIWDINNDNSVCLQTLEGHSRYVTAVAFSPNSARLASVSDDRTVKIWDISGGSNTCLQTLEGYSVKVNPHDLVSTLASLYSDRDVAEVQPSVHQGAAISLDGTWITENGQNLLWIPTEHRAIYSAVSGRYVGIGTGPGKVWICQLL
ncbi:WD40-repeat-containing domain protein [Phaeosphaeria sp. MPI-PUGE-AT-0046c]|nr:WD40-repeat-containing domain protein [Phaeosphaeria sp. MPI-PUGE-AT-0046c]